jgi:hypothetical protein
MEYTNNNGQNSNCGLPNMSIPNGQDGSWVPVDASTLPFTVGGNPNQPVQGPDGSYYCVGQSSPSLGSINANQYNAIPTPSQMVQLPPIVQPIALVPYSSQNQPLMQYNPNYQPEVPIGNTNDPVYKAKPYSSLSVLLILFAVIAGVVITMLSCLSTTSSISGIDAITSLAQKLGIGAFSTVYYTTVFNNSTLGTDTVTTIIIWAIPVIFALLLFFAIILVLKYLVKLGKKTSPRAFSGIAFIGLLLSIINLVLMLLSDIIIGYTLTAGIGMYVIVIAYFLLFICPFGAKKGAVVVDLEASKRVYNSNC